MEEDKYYYCHIVGTTDVGCVRKANEDSLGSRETINGLAAVVCDGMGGHVGGATASRLSVDTILNFLDQSYFADPREAIGKAIDAANAAVLLRTQVEPNLRGMGSTCVLLLVRDGQVYYGHVGDSRIYLVRKHTIKQLTKDQSYVQMLVDMGQITPEEAEHHERKNEITNAIGIAGMQHATVADTPVNPEAGDCFLLCSDGLSGMVSDHEIEKIVSSQVKMRAQERADALVDKAKQYGGLDNVTAQIVEFSVTPNQDSKILDKKKLCMYGGIGLAVIAILLTLLIWKPWKPVGPTPEELRQQYIADSTAKAKADSVEKANKEEETVDQGTDFDIKPEVIEHNTSVKFEKLKVLATITFDEESTTVEIPGNEKPIVVDYASDLKSLKINPENEIEYSTKGNVVSLKFGEEKIDSLKFEFVSKGFPIKKHLFIVDVIDGGNKTTAKTKTKGSSTSKDPVRHDVKNLGEVEFQPNEVVCTVQFVGKDGVFSMTIFNKDKKQIDVLSGSDKKGFKNKSLVEYEGCVVKKNSGQNMYDVRFTENRPECNIVIFKAIDSKGNDHLFSVKVKPEEPVEDTMGDEGGTHSEIVTTDSEGNGGDTAQEFGAGLEELNIKEGTFCVFMLDGKTYFLDGKIDILLDKSKFSREKLKSTALKQLESFSSISKIEAKTEPTKTLKVTPYSKEIRGGNGDKVIVYSGYVGRAISKVVLTIDGEKDGRPHQVEYVLIKK